jgi:hypothetical protein
MKYEGPIYGVGRNHNGRKIYFDTGRTSQEWDAMEEKIEKLERENAALRVALAATLDRLEFYVECLPLIRSTYEKTAEGQVTARIIERARAAIDAARAKGAT